MADIDPCAPLCPCGIRGCEQAAQHWSDLIVPVPRFRMKARGARRHRRKR